MTWLALGRGQPTESCIPLLSGRPNPLAMLILRSDVYQINTDELINTFIAAPQLLSFFIEIPQLFIIPKIEQNSVWSAGTINWGGKC